MSYPVIRVAGVSKRYQLGTIGYGSLQHDLRAWWAQVRGRENPFAVVGDTKKDLNGEYWALSDVSFEVEKGQRIGIIGRNGAGKSTLLKLLSRVTSPTTGMISMRGKVSSLLEVGTGFHPELTGRENVFLNGAILGMKRREIEKKFDEIVDFSGVAQFIDTPVKRYSSGMYVRLAFSVAAHLESETMIVDEVLAVGDADFQKKCLGKMREVSEGQGRTILFVSHNTDAIVRLCNRGIYLSKGRVEYQGDIGDTLSEYLRNSTASPGPGDGWVRIAHMAMSNGQTWYRNEQKTASFDIALEFGEPVRLSVEVIISDRFGRPIIFVPFGLAYGREIDFRRGENRLRMTLELPFLAIGEYSVDLLLARSGIEVVQEFKKALRFDVVDSYIAETNYEFRVSEDRAPILVAGSLESLDGNS